MTPETLAAIAARAYRHMRPWSARDLADVLASPHGLLEAEAEGFVLGRVVADEAEILALAVLPEAQGQGHARRLLARFESAARARGAAEVFLEVAAGNIPAQSLYLRAGYTQIGLRKAYYIQAHGPAEDALCLRKVLVAENAAPASADSTKSG